LNLRTRECGLPGVILPRRNSVTSASKEIARQKLGPREDVFDVTGRGLFPGSGEVGASADPCSAPSLLDALLAISDEVPEAEFATLPTDLSENLDYCSYGSTKK
jgi:hypothetical protein